MRTTRLSIFVSIVAIAVGGCSTYVNIPAQTGDIAHNNPNITDIVTIQARAVKAVAQEQKADRPFEGAYFFVLPQGANARSYNTAQKEVGELATCGTLPAPGPREEEWDKPFSPQVPANVPTLDVRQILIRGYTGQVDVVRPSDPKDARQPAQLVTVYMKWTPLDGWYAQRMHAWHMPVGDALKRSRLDAETETPAGPRVEER